MGTFLLWGLAIFGGLAVIGLIINLFNDDDDDDPPTGLHTKPPRQQSDPLIEMMWYDAFRHGGR